ncbi:hypothetical protein [Streptomyces sp. SID3343]|uniref:hypothetical protein n=1 Tax=Streptomyces sp. SID3343 TaxID=2690260 RepID=UPI0013681A85|nr:hypothetical protein [Streptomyces sp. SID3343]MYW03352.1 hypothetical protein [Streptomyces sp. SID3343]MYW06242.1 hypothetical protein [Streptomyces sp. SID3343]
MAPTPSADRGGIHATPRPGTHRATTTLGAPPRKMMNTLPPDGPHLVIVKLVQRAATHLDELDDEFRSHAQWLATDLTHAADRSHRLFNPSGVVQMAGQKIDLLATRIKDADTHLQALLDAYTDLGPAPAPTTTQPTRAHAADAEAAPTRAAATRRSPTSRSRPTPPETETTTSAPASHAGASRGRR